MSHFSVIVIGDDVEGQLAPFHEYECTGVDDEYVEDVDVTEEFLAHLDHETQAVKLVDGTIVSKYDNRFYTKEPGDEFARKCGRKEFELPAGCEIITLTERELLKHEGKTEEEEASDYGNYTFKEGRYYKRTNPNAQWDWYQIGGRWSGWLKLKAGSQGELGDRSLLDDSKDDRAGYADVMRKGDIDFAGMMKEAGDKAGEQWDKCRVIVGETLWESWESVRERMPIEEARTFYHEQAGVKKLNDAEFYTFELDDHLLLSRAEFVERAENRSFVPYAIIKDSEWYARGEMGWWGISTGDMPESDWNKRVTDMLLALPDDTQITVVDCHI